MKGDERILGNSDFVETVLKECLDEFDRRYLLKSGGYDFDTVVDRVAQVLGMNRAEYFQADSPIRSMREAYYVSGHQVNLA